MNNLKPVNATRRDVGAGQGYIGIDIVDRTINDSVNGRGTPQMTTYWDLDDEERRRIAAGAPIALRILGNIPPPLIIEVVEPYPTQADQWGPLKE
jgi:hypothetical protein